MTGLHSSVGLTIGSRDEQQDCAVAVPLQRGKAIVGELLVLADGMGGHAGGQEASRLVVDAIVEIFSSSGHLDAPARLKQALERANQAVGAATKDNPELRGMGATLVAVAVDFQARMLHWISVGDSHLYLANGAQLHKLNADHSFAPLLAKQVEAGELTEKEAASHEKRNTLMSAIIGRPIPLIDEGEVELEAGCSLLLASDGLDTLAPATIAHTLRCASSTKAAVQELLKLTEDEQHPEQDNTSVVVLNVSKKLVGANSSKASPGKNAGKSGSSKGLLIAIIVASLLLSGGVAGWLIGTSSSSSNNDSGSSPDSGGTALSSTEQEVSSQVPEAPRNNSNADIVKNASNEVVEANTLQGENERAGQPDGTAPARPVPRATQEPSPSINQPNPEPTKAPKSQIGPDFLEDGNGTDPEVVSPPPVNGDGDATSQSLTEVIDDSGTADQSQQRVRR